MNNVYVIIVTFNPLKWINKTLNSILTSKCNPRIIIIDNGSTDGSINIIKSQYAQVDLIQSNENLGFGKANNIGIKKAYDSDADFVFLLNQDAWLNKNALDELVLASRHNPEYGIVSPIHLNGQGNALDKNFSHFLSSKITPDYLSDLYMNAVQNKLYRTTYVNAAAWLLSRKCVETVGGFHPSFFMYAEDDNYFQRVHYHGLKVGVYPFAEIYHDREQRTVPKQLVNKEIIEKRNWILKYSNPNEEFKLDEDISLLRKGIKRALFKGQFDLAKHHKSKLSKLKHLRTELFKHYQISKKPGLSFLYD